MQQSPTLKTPTPSNCIFTSSHHMEIQQLISPSPATSATTTPYATAPSSPHRFPNLFYSVPTSPIHDDNDFAFDFSGQLEPPSISAADELFHGGKIKPLKLLSTDQPKSRFTQVFSPRCKKKNPDSFTLAFDRTGGVRTQSSQYEQNDQHPQKRGREKAIGTNRTRDKVSRSSSPFRISDILSEEDTNQKNTLTWYNKWNLRNLLLFRSASEGCARRSKDPVNKYSRIRKVVDNDVKNASFRSTESCSSVMGSNRRVMRKVSAHEIHYTENRAMAEEMRRKTYLPYKSGLLGCLGFRNIGAGSEISRGVTSVMKRGG